MRLDDSQFRFILWLDTATVMGARAPSNRRGKSICLPCESEAAYRAWVADPQRFRQVLQEMSTQHPELFPAAFSGGFQLHDTYQSVKQGLQLRRIKLTQTGEVFLVRPSLVMPYLGAKTDEMAKALYLRQWGVPFEALAYVFGRDAMFYYRAWVSLGRYSLVGTTIKQAAQLPTDLLADEKHTGLGGDRHYVATTVGGGCFLGAEIVAAASTPALQAGYQVFLTEARAVQPDSQPETVCTDGWPAPREAWQLLVATITLILCFLHSILKIEARCRGALRQRLRQRAGHVYQAPNKVHFAQRIRRLREWARSHLEGAVQATVLKLCELKDQFSVAYDFPAAARTTNGIDRLMDYQDRVLYGMRYLHGTRQSARWAVRAMALQWNFHPYSARAQSDGARPSPFEALNGFPYHTNWLHNLLSAASMGGRKL
jgi:hypothetical protein